MRDRRFATNGLGAVCTLVACLALAGQTRAADLHVPGDFPTIQAAINAAVNGDVVIVAAGNYDENINYFGKAITVRSTDPDDPAVVSNTRIRGDNDVVTILANGAILDGLLITRVPGTPNIVQGLEAAGNSTTTVRNCIFYDLNNQGGSVVGQMLVSRCLFFDCHDFSAGGGVIAFQTPSFDHCVFRGNSTFGSGGAVFVQQNSSPTFTNCLFEDNLAGEFKQGGAGLGGAIRVNNNSSPTFTGCTFRENRTVNPATGDPNGSGAIFINAGSTANVGSSLFCENGTSEIIGTYTDLGGNTFVFGCPSPGACCLEGACLVALEADCLAAGGVFEGDLALCTDVKCPAPTCPADFAPPGGDGSVGIIDLLALLGDWGACP